jgi:hypothetical protein
MPNWCLNNLIVSHADKAMVQKFVDAYNTGGVCEQFIPKPPEEDWYSWNVSNWGTKWDFGTDKNYDDPVEVKQNGDKYEVTVAPSTAWSPPIEFYDHLVGLGYKVHASYFEPGMGFCGIYNDGHDNYIDYGDDKDSIPVGVWNDFALDDFFEMMEEDV